MIQYSEKSISWWAMLAVIAGTMMWSACEGGCNQSEIMKGPGGAYELAEAIPSDARAVLFADELGELLPQLERVIETLPMAVPPPAGVDYWKSAGAKLDSPAAAFWSDGQWVVVAWVDQEKEVGVGDWPSTGDRQIISESEQAVNAWQEMNSDGIWERWVTSDGRRLAAGWRVEPGATPLDATMWTLDDDHWRVDARQERLSNENQLEGQPAPVAHGAIDAGKLLMLLGGEDRAGFLLRQLADQIGTVYWAVRSGESRKNWVIDLYTPGRSGVPLTIGDLGEARGELPPLGGLARPGVPGIIRLSADPEQLLELVRSTLQVEERQRFDATMEALRGEVSVDVKDDFVSNLKGQLAVVVFGLEDKFFETSGMGRLASLLRLESTREAVVVPIEDREDMQAVLDAFTQLSRGGLRRRAMEHTIQYAWFDDGALMWALILGDEHLVIVDSMVALNHVGSWERSPRPLDGVFADRKVESMLTPNRGIGIYLDIATVRSIVREGGGEELVPWLKPLEALRIQTDIDDRPERTQIEVWLSGRLFDDDE